MKKMVWMAGNSAVLRTLPLSWSLNRWICGYAIALPKPLPSVGASHIPQPLYAICGSLNMLFDLIKNYEDVKWR